jgi:hypothetical protein
VLTEVGDGLAVTGSRTLLRKLVARLQGDSRVTLIPPEDHLFSHGIELYDERGDKAWSRTDCISFVVMHDLDLRDALTADHHFEQAGFVALLK